MAVEGGRGVRGRGTTRDSDLAEDRADIGLRHGDQHGRTADLGHGRDNKVGVDVLDSDALGSQLGTNSLGPARQEGLGSRVNREVGSGDQSSERAQVDNQTLLAIMLVETKGGLSCLSIDLILYLFITIIACMFQGSESNEWVSRPKKKSVPSNHVGDDDLGDLHGRVDVDLDDILNNLVSLLLEGGGDFMVGSDVVDCCYCCCGIQLIPYESR